MSRQRKKKRALERAREIARIRRLNEPLSSPFRRSSTRTGTKQSLCQVEEEFGCKHNSSAPLKQERRSRKRRREKKRTNSGGGGGDGAASDRSGGGNASRGRRLFFGVFWF